MKYVKLPDISAQLADLQAGLVRYQVGQWVTCRGQRWRFLGAEPTGRLWLDTGDSMIDFQALCAVYRERGHAPDSECQFELALVCG